MKKSLMLCSIAGVLLLFALPTHAETPLFSLDRASAGVTANYAWYGQAGDQPLPTWEKEWEFGAVAAYNLVAMPEGKAPLLSLTYSLNYGMDNKWWRHRLGVTLVLWKGSDR